MQAVLTLSLLYFLAHLCLGDLLNDKCSCSELVWPVMICHVIGRGERGNREEEEKKNKKKKKGRMRTKQYVED